MRASACRSSDAPQVPGQIAMLGRARVSPHSDQRGVAVLGLNGLWC